MARRYTWLKETTKDKSIRIPVVGRRPSPWSHDGDSREKYEERRRALVREIGQELQRRAHQQQEG